MCVESVDDNCLLSGASMLRGATLTCGSSSTWSTMRHQAFFFHHQDFGGTVGADSARCFAVDRSAKACRTSGRDNSTTCLLREGMCLMTKCDSKGQLSAVFKFDNGDVSVPCPTGKHHLRPTSNSCSGITVHRRCHDGFNASFCHQSVMQ